MTHSQFGDRSLRIRYHDDQRLNAQDLQAEADAETRLRELHVRALHNTWGVALGFEVMLKGNVVQVGPGLAYDCQGREILSARPLAIALPHPLPSSRAFDLVIRYADRATLLGDRPRTICQGDRSPTEERFLWRWSDAGVAEPNQPLPLADDVRLGEEIPIARLQLEAGVPPVLDTALRRTTQGLTRPHLVSGQVRSGSVTAYGSPLAWSVYVDTSSGGFRGVGAPSGVFYFANLLNHPFSDKSGFTRFLSPAALTRLMRELTGPFVSIANPYANSYSSGFRLDVRFGLRDRQSLIRLLTDLPELNRNQNPLLPVGIHWLGVELVKGCPPPALSQFAALPIYAYLL